MLNKQKYTKALLNISSNMFVRNSTNIIDSLTVQIIDISVCGLEISSESEVEMNSIIEMEIIILKQKFKIIGQITDKNLKIGQYHYEIQFEHISNESLLLIKRYVLKESFFALMA